MSFNDTRSWMWDEACSMIERAERMHRQFFQLATSSTRHPAWEPPVDIFETEHELWILIAMPGVLPHQIQVGVNGNFLVIIGDRPLPGELRGSVIHRLEIPQGRFERHIELPAGRFEVGAYTLANGCLLLNLHKCV